MTSDALHKYKQEAHRKKHIRNLLTHAGLVLLVLAYSFAGAAIFQALEEGNEQQVRTSLAVAQRGLRDKLWLGNVDVAQIDQGNWTKMVDKLFSYYHAQLADAVSTSADIRNINAATESPSKWDFWGSLFYAGTVFTTIGYGNVAPVTRAGKLATMIYAFIGIPICLILLADLATLLSKAIKNSIKCAKRLIYRCGKRDLKNKWPPCESIDSLSGLSVLAVLCIVIVLYLFAGAALYKSLEDDWTYLDAVYFIFISTSTIGFGDMIPSNKKYFLLSSLYIFFGLSLISTVFTVLQDILQTTLEGVKTRLDTTLGLQMEPRLHQRSVETQVDETLLGTCDRNANKKQILNDIDLDDLVHTLEATIVL